MKIVADENIPLVKELFASLGEIVLLPGRKISHADVIDADILLVRSVTNVNKKLLLNTSIKFVGTATTGVEHIDIDWLKENTIFFADAKGANAQAVAEYVTCCIASLQQRGFLSQKKICAGIIGVGHVGARVVQQLKILDFEILCNDPPRVETDKNFISTPLLELSAADVICLHTPLTETDRFPTYHLINRDFLTKLKPGCILLNAGRGAVINFDDLMKYGQHLVWCFDVWEYEPNLDLSILKKATIATPHIAGYTMEAKLRGALMLYEAAQKFLKFSAQPCDASLFPNIDLALSSDINSWQDALLQVYNPMNDTNLLRQTILDTPNETAQQFDDLRKHYPKRHEFASITLKNISGLKNFDQALLKQLNFKISM